MKKIIIVLAIVGLFIVGAKGVEHFGSNAAYENAKEMQRLFENNGVETKLVECDGNYSLTWMKDDGNPEIAHFGKWDIFY